MSRTMTIESLWKLRQEIILNSLFISDYRNSFGIDPHAVCDFFDGYLVHLEYEMNELVPGYDDRQFFDLLPAYDTAENLWNWYYYYLEEDPLPLPVEVDMAA